MENDKNEYLSESEHKALSDMARRESPSLYDFCEYNFLQKEMSIIGIRNVISHLVNKLGGIIGSENPDAPLQIYEQKLDISDTLARIRSRLSGMKGEKYED